MDFLHELAVTFMPEYPVDSTKTSVRDRVENGGECRGVGVLPLLRKVVPNYANCPRHPSAIISWVSRKAKFVGSVEWREGSGQKVGLNNFRRMFWKFR